MDISHKNTDALNGELVVKVGPNDYEERVKQSLKDYRKKAAIKGFRPGKAPEGLINKMYRVPVLVEEVNRFVSESISEYMQSNEIKILGELLPSEAQESIDWETQTEYEFKFDMGFMPEFDVTLTKKNKIPYYIIKVDKEMRGKYTEGIRKQFGQYVECEQANTDSLIYATLSELNEDQSPKEDGHNVGTATIALSLIANKDEQAKLIGAKVGDVVVIDTHKAYEDSAKRATFLEIDKEMVEGLNPLFQVTVNEVKEYKDAEMNQELFDKAFGPDAVKGEEEFNAKVDEVIQGYLKNDSERQLMVDMRSKILEKCSVELPNEFLIRWLAAINEGKFTVEQIKEDYSKFEEDLKWQLVRDRIATVNGIEITEDEVKGFARMYVSSQMQSYGMAQLPESFVEGYVEDLMKKKDQRKQFAEGVLENKVAAWIKEAVKLDEKQVSMDEFKKIVEKNQSKE